MAIIATSWPGGCEATKGSDVTWQRCKKGGDGHLDLLLHPLLLHCSIIPWWSSCKSSLIPCIHFTPSTLACLVSRALWRTKQKHATSIRKGVYFTCKPSYPKNVKVPIGCSEKETEGWQPVQLGPGPLLLVALPLLSLKLTPTKPSRNNTTLSRPFKAELL